jgi:hypothetical protein
MPPVGHACTNGELSIMPHTDDRGAFGADPWAEFGDGNGRFWLARQVVRAAGGLRALR